MRAEFDGEEGGVPVGTEEVLERYNDDDDVSVLGVNDKCLVCICMSDRAARAARSCKTCCRYAWCETLLLSFGCVIYY